MAAPVIRSINITPPTVPPGGSTTITVDAFDPDSSTVAITVEVTDSGGNKTEGSGTISVSDPISCVVTASQGKVTQQSALVFTWTDQ